MRKLCLSIALIAMFAVPVSADQKAETVLDGLNNPTGVAIQPETGTVFVSDSGAGRVIRVVDGKAENVITDFPQDVYGKGPKYNIGPLGLAFIDKDTLVVGGGGYKDGEELLRVYAVPAPGESIKAEKMTSSFKLEATDALKGEGNFYGVTVNSAGIFVTCNGDDTKGWIGKAHLAGQKVGPFERSIKTKEAVDVDAPTAITSRSGEKGDQLVVGQLGEISQPEDSLLTFYDTSGKLLLDLDTGLYDITGLAYSPKGQLYATDFAWLDTSKGGLFQLIRKVEDGQQVCEAKKIASLDKPTALAFGPDGSLYITVIGEPEKGKLVKIAPGL